MEDDNVLRPEFGHKERKDKVCGNCGGTWAGTACLDCGATRGMISDAVERPGSTASLLLNLLRHSEKERGKEIRP